MMVYLRNKYLINCNAKAVCMKYTASRNNRLATSLQLQKEMMMKEMPSLEKTRLCFQRSNVSYAHGITRPALRSVTNRQAMSLFSISV